MIRFVLIFTLLVVGCEQISGTGRTGPVDEVDLSGIVFGESIEGIAIGDSASAVRQKLRAPDEVVRGDFPGVIYRYTEGNLAGLDVEVGTDTTVGKGVLDVCVSAPYEGKTEEGVGVGTSREEVLQKLGEAGSTLSTAKSESTYDIYHFKEKDFQINYQGESGIRSLCVKDQGVYAILRGTVIKTSGDTPSYYIYPDFDDGYRYNVDYPFYHLPSSSHLPGAFRKDGLQIIFSGRAVNVPSNVRISATPLVLISVEKRK